METLFLLVIVALMIIWVSSRTGSSRETKEYIETDKFEPEVTVSFRTNPPTSSDYPDSGPLAVTDDGGWILNSKSTFPISIYGIDRPVAQQFKKLLDEGYSQHTYGDARTLVPIIARSNLRCKEIDAYVAQFKPQYLRKIEELKQSSTDWSSASERDREDLLTSFREQAMESLDVRPYCDLEILFEDEPTDVTVDDTMIDRYGYENLQLYLRYAGKLDKVHVIAADHYERAGFEKLVEMELAIRGAEIPLSAILETLTLKEMKELASNLDPPSFGRKAKAIEFLMKAPDIKERISKVVAFRELFQLRPLPAEFSHIDLDQISTAWRYASEIGTIIAHTYAAAGYATNNRNQYGDDIS